MFALKQDAFSNDVTLSAAMEGRDVRVYLSRAAQHALDLRTSPLVAEMELYFSCLIRLQVRFHEGAGSSDAIPVSDKLAIRFRPVAGRRCDLHAVEGSQPLDDFPIVKRSSFVPHWLHIDYQKSEWVGNFGYRDAPA